LTAAETGKAIVLATTDFVGRLSDCLKYSVTVKRDARRHAHVAFTYKKEERESVVDYTCHFHGTEMDCHLR
jgi:hypothetical protein